MRGWASAMNKNVMNAHSMKPRSSSASSTRAVGGGDGRRASPSPSPPSSSPTQNNAFASPAPEDDAGAVFVMSRSDERQFRISGGTSGRHNGEHSPNEVRRHETGPKFRSRRPLTVCADDDARAREERSRAPEPGCGTHDAESAQTTSLSAASESRHVRRNPASSTPRRNHRGHGAHMIAGGRGQPSVPCLAMWV